MMRLSLEVFPQTLAVARLATEDPVPSWVRGSFTSVTRTADELSIVCDAAAVPGDVRAERGWRVLRVAGPIAFETTGVAAALIAPLAAAQISVFLIATFDTDYLLLKAERFEESLGILRHAGHDVA
jgi:hypothetical protein